MARKQVKFYLDIEYSKNLYEFKQFTVPNKIQSIAEGVTVISKGNSLEEFKNSKSLK